MTLPSNDAVTQFETLLADFYNSKFAVATDCCTHALELCLRYTGAKYATCPKQTYLSIPMMMTKLGISWHWQDNSWKDYYYITDNIIDGAVYWQKNGYVNNSFMCLSFQFKKHLNLSKGGAILCNNLDDYIALKKMSHDGRYGEQSWKVQDVDTIGYHYQMSIETAKLGCEKFEDAKSRPAKQWSHIDYPDLTTFKVFDKWKI